jgi:SAM-dependent methyltransferase
MSALRQVRSFYDRRVALPVEPDALVLDVGSGDKPHWRADVLLDRYSGSEHGVQRSGQAAARLDRPMFDADAASMPFADQRFDYVICSHLLEHVTDPAAVIEELMRVAKAGYIEVPSITSAKISDFPSHLWWCDMVDGELVLTAKTSAHFDPDIERFVSQPEVQRDLHRVVVRNFDRCIVQYRWVGSIRYRVVGTASPALIEAAAVADVHHRGMETLAARTLTSVLTLPRARQRHSHTLTWNQLVKPSLQRHPDLTLEAGLVSSDAGAAGAPDLG